VYERGDILTDREQDSEVVVVQLDSRRADEVVVKEGRYSDFTVYDYNSRRCDPSEPVVHAVYSSSLPADPHELTGDGRATLAQNADVQTYAFPISRLTSADNSQNSS
jgi:hypothetical protein